MILGAEWFDKINNTDDRRHRRQTVEQQLEKTIIFKEKTRS